jgi:hypothetical protein
MRLAELEYLARQRRPVWQGVVGRESEDPEFQSAIDRGLIERMGDGFVLSAKGREHIRSHICPTCGQQVKK